MTKEQLNELGAEIPELALRGIPCEEEVRIQVFYKGRDTRKYFNIDLLVCGEIVLELKAVKEMNPYFEAKLINHLRLSDKRLGYLVDFNVVRLKEGFRRFVNKLY
ncbi:MAG: GxxExxY protein [Sphingobacteriales bacterium]|nr:GxxExxY protein [Sphingobacteriales bacterium]